MPEKPRHPVQDPAEVRELPLLPLKNAALLPNMLIPLSVGRPTSRAAVDAALRTPDKHIVIVAQRDPSVDEPEAKDLYTIGVIGAIQKVQRNGEEHLQLLVLGIERAVVLKIESESPYLKARVRAFPVPAEKSTEIEALERSIFDLAAKAITMAYPQTPANVAQLMADSEDALSLAYALAGMLSLDLEKQQSLLEAPTRAEALRLMYRYLAHEIEVFGLRQKIAEQAGAELSKEQREYVLRRQMRAIQEELGEKDGESAEVDQLRERLEKAELPEDVRKEALRELHKLEKLPAAAPDYHVTRTYLEFVLELPWNKAAQDSLDIPRARQVLDEDHYELKEVKERILEHLSVLKFNPGAKSPILCFAGPPGVGKTSLGQSIARALGRPFERMSLGGLHDEAELRGHRRTYVGAMPGRVLQAVRRAGANNPVLMLDEVDKLGRDFRGDPAAALLEILDPEQNKAFHDNYLNLGFDLSKVFFITTANTLDTVPRPLLDRMEIISLSGYSEPEKMEIARRYLIPRQLKNAGLTGEQCVISDEALRELISGYTREAGLRRLEQAIGKVTRKITLKMAEGAAGPFTIRGEDVAELLGPAPFSQEDVRRDGPPGVATGLAWTETGGDVLYVEATLLPEGKGMTLTGQLGEVMQESAKAAQSYIWSHARELGIDPALFKDAGVHVHVPAGAIPKDGPSAGITMTVALASMYTGFAARLDTAMTGEVTLTGLVLPIGGVKEKVLAARRNGIRRIILPKGNRKDLRDLPEFVRQDTEFLLVERIQDVLRAAIPPLAERLPESRDARSPGPVPNGAMAARG